MRFDVTFVIATLLSGAAAGVIDPQLQAHANTDVVARDDNDLFKRKGGGGGGGGRGGGGGGGSSSGGRSGSGSGSSSGSGGSRGNTGSGSNFGGSSRGGTGPPRAYGGGGYYGGGAARPYRSGLGTAAGVGALAFGAGALAFWPGTWYHGANLYPHRNDFQFFNSTTQRNERLPVVCGCAQYEECGCDENPTTLKELVGNGTYDGLNKSLINVGDYNGRKTLLVNGTLPNGTTIDGPDSPAMGMGGLANAAGIWSLTAFVVVAGFLV
ncbi:hypothetical protein E4U47_006725 [Claviceps purpurea]|nr:hypothetical protein E4U25_007368 [Claviceps purpurea]KAG6264836.1 hypothetical protein E4U47_006725 [Claviceps purpurea]